MTILKESYDKWDLRNLLRCHRNQPINPRPHPNKECETEILWSGKIQKRIWAGENSRY